MTSKILERTVGGLLLVIAAGMAVHTPVTLWLGLQWPQADLFIKSWKELLMGLALTLLVVIAVRRKAVDTLLNDRLVQLSLVFAGIHFLMVGLFQNGLNTAGAGLLIDLRYVLYFALVYIYITLFPAWRRLFLIVVACGAAVIIGFGVLQALVLPKDILAHIGYSKATIAPYLTVDENPAYVRINSLLRGPNPLGAYAVIALGILTAVLVRWRLRRRAVAAAAVAIACCGLVLAVTYSRSSLIAALVTIAVIVIVSLTVTMRRRVGIALGAAVVVAGLTLFALRDTAFVSNVILHDSPTTGAAIDSNSGHADSLIDGTQRLLRQPLGAGVGSTGSASLIGDKPLIIENQYLFVAHEVGWAGLAVFAWLYVEILRRAWQRRASALALGVFGSGIGLGVIGLLLPVWTDDTVSIIWWGLAAVAVAIPIVKRKKTKEAK